MTIYQRIEAFNKTRQSDLLPYKLAAMAENPFRFFRGTCHLFYEDLHAANPMPASPPAWISGDLHLENFGSFKSDNRQVYFDLNDFDEAILAPAIWEIVRMTTSIFVAFDSLGIESKRAEKMAALYLKSYARTLQTGKPDYIEPRTARGIVCEFLEKADQKKQKAILLKRTRKEKSALRINLKDKRHLKLDKSLKKEIKTHMQHWLSQDEYSPYNYTITDIVLRLAGTGSLGLPRYELLLLSSNDVGEKYILLDMKQAASSSLAPYTNLLQPTFLNEASRVAELQRRMQNRPPALLSSTIFKGQPFIIQEMQPEKDSINFRLLKDRYRDMYQVVDSMGILTASAQLRSAGRQGAANIDDLILFGGDESWQEEVAAYARQYARQVKTNYQAYVRERPIS
ncbi:MAG TPA: DUF2252 family protein [Puia sp.]|jgi:uncharacterized protein (DUF2252 family)